MAACSLASHSTSTCFPAFTTAPAFSLHHPVLPPFFSFSAAATSVQCYPAKPTNLKLSAVFFEQYNINPTTRIGTINNTTKTKVSFFPAFLTKSKDARALKEELLEAIEPLNRGADANPDDQKTIDQIARKLEAVSPTKQPLKSDLLNGKWELIYTTSKSILQTERPKFLRTRVNYQAINADTLRAQNMESWPFFNQVTADLTPLNSRKVAVKFDYFKIGGLIPIKAPETARGELDITYLDEDLRVSRGDKGNLFILKMIDPSYRVPVK